MVAAFSVVLAAETATAEPVLLPAIIGEEEALTYVVDFGSLWGGGE